MALFSRKDNFLGRALTVTAVLLVTFFATVVFITLENNQNQETILENSVKSELMAISIAARDIIDVDSFESYNSLSDIKADQAAWNATVKQLRALKDEMGAEYIYALKYVDGEYVFIFDTDDVSEEIFGAYELSVVHERAFAGEASADVLNVDDKWGSFNTGAVPIVKNGTVIGIVSTDIEDTYLEESKAASQANGIILVVTMLISMGILFAVLFILLRRMYAMQEHLKQIANFDTVTGLPNRQYLFNYLTEAQTEGTQSSFAVLFIDLDNFKRVNDSAGHDAGDELLRSIATYLNGSETSDSPAHSAQEAPITSEMPKNASDCIPIRERDSNVFGFNRRSPNSLDRVSARIGGDEFLQIVPDVSNAEDAAAAAQQLLDGFAQQPDLQPFIKDFHVGLSIGIALYPHDSTDYTELIKFADIAMYHSKNAGKNGYTLYNESMGGGAEDMPLTVHMAD